MSFFSLDAENVIISTIKKAEDDNGIIVRAYEIEGTDAKSELKSFKLFESLIRTNLIEEGSESVAIDGKPVLRFGKYAIETFKLK